MAVVYQHIRKDTNEVFYVGIGKEEKRAYSKYCRNSHWRNIVNKTGYYVEIIYSDLPWELACNMEQYLIESYGRIDLKTATLCNLTDGGEGSKNISIESKLKMSNSKKELYDNGYINPNKGRKLSEETKLKISEANKGNKGILFTEEHKIKISQRQKGRKLSDETREKMSNSKKGRKFSDETKKKMSENHTSKKEGYINPRKNKKVSEETLTKMIQSKSKKVINIETGEIYNSVKELSEILNINYNTLQAKLKGSIKNNTNFKYI
jgi:hypothetical protein